MEAVAWPRMDVGSMLPPPLLLARGQLLRAARPGDGGLLVRVPGLWPRPCDGPASWLLLALHACMGSQPSSSAGDAWDELRLLQVACMRAESMAWSPDGWP